eukprot:jgi/Mesen1/5724/ME000289S04818
MANFDAGEGDVLDPDMSRSQQSIWLIKLPTFVAEGFKAAGKTGGSMGRVRMALDPLNPDAQNTEYSLHLAPCEGVSIPLSYVLKYTPDNIPMQVFAQHPEGTVSVEGRIEAKLDVQPGGNNDASYRQLIKTRDKSYNTPKRKLQVWLGDRGGVTSIPLPGDSLAAFTKDKRKAAERERERDGGGGARGGGIGGAGPSRPSDAKRVRMSRDSLEALVFKLFESQPHWGLKQLIDATEQPQQFLKDILNELCVYNKRGMHQGMYELKPEYRQQAPAPAAAAAKRDPDADD